MHKADLVRFRHILDSAREAISFAQNRTRTDLDSDRMLTLALVKAIEIIGEAAANVTKATQIQYPQIPWSNMIGMRNRLIHAYFNVNLNIVWQTVTQHPPSLIAALEKIVQFEEKL
ncbi:DUF86 domain-containing protein [Candidatus Poribacteria bacterium]|nr:DUF86 domain-containing protein [Candidatus Poribacteria bacterium]